MLVHSNDVSEGVGKICQDVLFLLCKSIMIHHFLFHAVKLSIFAVFRSGGIVSFNFATAILLFTDAVVLILAAL